MRTRVAVVSFIAVAVVGGVVVVWPQALGLAAAARPAQAVAMRGSVGAAAAAVTVVLLIVALVLRRGRRYVAIAGTLAIAVVVVQAGVLYSRGLNSDLPAAHTEAPADAVRVLAFNILYDRVPGSDIVELVERYDADIVVLSEASAETANEVADEAGGFQVFADERDSLAASTALLVHERLGHYGPPEFQPGGILSSFTVRPLSGDGPPITAVHTYPPGPGQMRQWRDDGEWAVEQCEQLEGAIVAGDLNATLDHPMLSDVGGDSEGSPGRPPVGCVDAAAEQDAAGVGTWPSQWAPWLGAAIDHVLVDGDQWNVHAFTVVDLDHASDHRPVVATLVPH